LNVKLIAERSFHTCIQQGAKDRGGYSRSNADGSSIQGDDGLFGQRPNTNENITPERAYHFN